LIRWQRIETIRLQPSKIGPSNKISLRVSAFLKTIIGYIAGMSGNKSFSA
jgi:hypothetical protein